MSNTQPSAISGDLPAAASEQGMADSKELSAFAFQRTRMPMVVADARQPDLPIVLANDAFLKLTGYAADEVLGRNCRFLQGESTSQTAVAEIRAALAGEHEATIEILNYRKDGTPFWNQLHFSPIYDDVGRLAYFFASQIDVTEHRRIETLEEAEHRLLLEVDHRTKNVLAIVDSIVRLSNADDARVYAASIQRRVQALSRTHKLLAENGWQQVAFDDIIRTQLAVFGDDNVEIRGPIVMVTAHSVQPIGLAIHELAANAAIHGSLSQADGKLNITWRSDGDGVALYWEELGCPRPARKHGTGLGNALLAAVVENQLSGRITRTWRDEGLILTLELPSLERVGRRRRKRPQR